MCFFLIGKIHAQKYANHIIDDIKYIEGSFTVTVPKWIVNKVFKESVKMPDSSDYLVINQLRNNLGKLRFSTIGNQSVDLIDKKKLEQLQLFDGYQLYSKIHKEGNYFRLYLRKDQDIIKNLFLIIESKNEGIFVMNLESNIYLNDFENLDLSFNKNIKNEK
jgi:hypothetical protein